MRKLILILGLSFIGCGGDGGDNGGVEDRHFYKYTLHTDITTTYFYVGEDASIANYYIANSASA